MFVLSSQRGCAVRLFTICLCLMMCWVLGVVQMMLVYTEATLIAQYIFQIPTRLHCHIFTAQEQARCVFHS